MTRNLICHKGDAVLLRGGILMCRYSELTFKAISSAESDLFLNRRQQRKLRNHDADVELWLISVSAVDSCSIPTYRFPAELGVSGVGLRGGRAPA